MFLNVSHHPWVDPLTPWSTQQIEAAERLGGHIEDELFPDVPPEASLEDVARTGDALVQRIVSRCPAAVLVQGEFTLTYYVVSALEKRGIPCYAATTRRTAELSAEGPAVTKRSIFEFVQLRRYSECQQTTSRS